MNVRAAERMGMQTGFFEYFSYLTQANTLPFVVLILNA